MRRVEWGWVDKADLPLWWTFVLLQKVWECHHQSSFVQCDFTEISLHMCCGPLDWQFKHGCQLFSANNMFEVMICIAKPFFFFFFCGRGGYGSVKTVWRKICSKPWPISQLLVDFMQLYVHFWMLWHYICWVVTFKSSLTCGTLYPVTYGDMACLFVIRNMSSKTVISMLICGKSKWFGLRSIFRMLLHIIPSPKGQRFYWQTLNIKHVFSGFSPSVWNHSNSLFKKATPFALFCLHVSLSFLPIKHSPFNCLR